ncbi:hypothetical protein HJG54_27995 [Leptolyngbya sp. NK1-12]|uniref:Uncharacterized protein n=1 Tax=Leptolyngbya sp. NK1-12 TaxID=2547451 RepID=A0AA96WJG5_9CYAN|nr:hypothetical protein [Leptolyngbya sp. NK1-12]WNZ26284.1 hypothetical protein HJG54_27995 [Leptolyngbya sp. NK1-12]
MSFVESGGFTPPTDPPANFSNSLPNEEPVKMTLTASRQAVDRMILLLHNRNIIAGSEWSRPIAIKNSTEVISVASRMIQID